MEETQILLVPQAERLEEQEAPEAPEAPAIPEAPKARRKAAPADGQPKEDLAKVRARIAELDKERRELETALAESIKEKSDLIEKAAALSQEASPPLKISDHVSAVTRALARSGALDHNANALNRLKARLDALQKK